MNESFKAFLSKHFIKIIENADYLFYVLFSVNYSKDLCYIKFLYK